MWHDYYTVTSVAEALDLLAQFKNRVRLISGGTDILLELERGVRPNVDILVDITRVPGLDQITLEDDHIRLGALVTHNHVVGSEIMVTRALPLAQACWEVGAPQIRNRATVAGNVITASPANDTITPLLALDACITLASQAGERTIRLADFYPGYRQTVMQPDEMLTAITIPAIQPHQAGVFLKLGLRRAQAISVLNLTVILGFENPQDRESLITSAAITLGCVAPTVIRLPEVEAFLIGKTLSEETIRASAQLASQIPHPIDDVRSTADYRTAMIVAYLKRALNLLKNREEAVHFPHDPAMLWGKTHAIVNEALPQKLHYERDQADTIVTSVNGKSYSVTGAIHKTLLRLLREDLKLTGTKEGCAEGECGACTVFLDGVAVMACMVPAPRAHGAEIVTVEGLAAEDGTLHPIQHGFVEAGAVQCGFCTPGFLMAGAKLLEEFPIPTHEQVEQSISGNLCRCTGYYKIVEAFERAYKEK